MLKWKMQKANVVNSLIYLWKLCSSKTNQREDFLRPQDTGNSNLLWPAHLTGENGESLSMDGEASYQELSTNLMRLVRLMKCKNIEGSVGQVKVSSIIDSEGIRRVLNNEPNAWITLITSVELSNNCWLTGKLIITFRQRPIWAKHQRYFWG